MGKKRAFLARVSTADFDVDANLLEVFPPALLLHSTCLALFVRRCRANRRQTTQAQFQNNDQDR
jgi:hypothetical protein